MKYSLIFFFASLFVVSCSSEKKSEERHYRELMDIHDKLMEQMGDVMRLEKDLTERISQLRAEDSIQDKQPRIEYLTTLKNNLEEAEEAMMDWMRSFDNEMEDMTHEEKMEYLQEEEQKMQKIEEQVNTAIKNAQEAID